LDARDLRWNHGIELRGPDSIHVASALYMKCEELLSANGKLARFEAQGSKLARMGLYAKRGKDTACLPSKYRQLDLEDGQKENRQ